MQTTCSAARPPRTPLDWLLRDGDGLSEENNQQALAYAHLRTRLCIQASLEPPLL